MKKLLFLPFLFLFGFTVYAQQNCITTDYLAVHWQNIDSATSFFICTNAAIPFTSTDFVDIRFSGALKGDEKIPQIKDADKELFSLFTNIQFGHFKAGDTAVLPPELKYVLKKMTKNSTAVIQYNFSRFGPVKPERKLTVYFKDQTDSAKVAAWIKQIKEKPFIDSTFYLSKEAAANTWSKENPQWKSFIQNNPLPSSVDLFIKESYGDSLFIVSLKNNFLNDRIIADVVYSKISSAAIINDLNTMLTKKYFITVTVKQ